MYLSNKGVCTEIICYNILNLPRILYKKENHSPQPKPSFSSLSPFSAMDSAIELVNDFAPFVREYKDGRIERLMGTEIVPPSVDPETGVTSKDVVLVPESGLSARLYLPKLKGTAPEKLPILVYYHGGGFVIESAFSPTYHPYLNSLVSLANVVAISVDYRRAPEHPLPTAHDDSWAALEWVASHSEGSGPEPWLSHHGDFNRVLVAGDSAGGNIAHHMAMRAGPTGLGHGVRFSGTILVHPFFWGSEACGPKEADPMMMAWVGRMWNYVYPSMVGSDDPLINPSGTGAPSLSGLGCTRVLVFVAENDWLNDRGRLYYKALGSSGWDGEVEMVETQGEGHVFHLLNPTCENAKVMMKRFSSFINQHYA
ncbi:putative carboxylesterase 12 [Tasmannia lanceolata]|uniref:putative carboxylesterase 12 n=1 Tax=Tasmannia lanceolata TaxID=3420 RepID=UPI00406499B7